MRAKRAPRASYPLRMRIRLIMVGLLTAGVMVGGAAVAQDTAGDPIVVIELGDPIDQLAIDFVIGTIANNPAHMYVLKIDSPGVSSGALTELTDAIVSAPAPVIAWVGPNPAVAYGGAAAVVNHADIRSAAPGVTIGYLDPEVQRGDRNPETLRPGDDVDGSAAAIELLDDGTITVEAGTMVVGFVDRVDPALGQLLVSLDGEVVQRGGESFTLDTATTQTLDGQESAVLNRQVRFIKPGLLDRFLRLGARPETAFLFLVFALAFAVFEFYAAGTGLMAFVAGTSFILAGYGMATLPMWWPAVGLVVVGTGTQVWGFVQNRIDWRAVVGTALVFAGGVFFTTSRPAYPPAVWMVTLATASSAIFIWYALTTVVRGRFATPTVGREVLIGQRCLVVDTLGPVGVVVVDGARWRATADRGVEISAGAPAEIVGVTGLLLEVDPLVGDPQEKN